MSEAVESVVRSMQERLHGLAPEQSYLREFLGTYQRTTLAVGKAIDAGAFEDPDRGSSAGTSRSPSCTSTPSTPTWPARGACRAPWRLAFDAPPDLPALRHVLLGINAHVNYDLPQALLAVISDEDFADAGADGVAAPRPRADRRRAVRPGRRRGRRARRARAHPARPGLLQPLNRLASKRFLREARQKVWHNTVELQRARLAGPEAYAVRLGELEVLSAARIADLLAPGQVLLRLAVAGFGVLLPATRLRSGARPDPGHRCHRAAPLESGVRSRPEYADPPASQAPEQQARSGSDRSSSCARTAATSISTSMSDLDLQHQPHGVHRGSTQTPATPRPGRTSRRPPGSSAS